MASAQNRKAAPNRNKSSAINLITQSVIAPNAVKKNVPVKMLINALSGYYLEGFEASFPPTGWQVTNVLDPAYIWSQSNASPYEGANSAYISYTATVDGEDWLIMPQFTVANADSLWLWLRPEFVGFPPDSTFILVSTTDSASSSFTTVLATLAEGLNYPTDTFYQNYSYDLSAFAGQNIYVAFVNKNNYGDGIFIDAVSIGTKPAADAGSYSIDMPSVSAAGIAALPLATVTNNGSATQTFNVTMTITGGYTSTKTVTALGASATQQVTFDPWTPSSGVKTIMTQTSLTGDANPNDDTLSKSINVLDLFTNYGWTIHTDLDSGYSDPAAAALNTNDTSYLFRLGGYASVISNAAAKFAPYSNSWSNLNTIPTGAFAASAAGANNKLYFIGGYNPNLTPVGVNQVYDMASGTWSLGTQMPTPVGDYAMGIYSHNYNTYIYCIGGYAGASGGDQNTVQIYNTLSNGWTSGTTFPFAAAGLRGGIVGNKIVVTGGFSQATGTLNASTYIGTIDSMNPDNITWTQVADYPTGAITRHGGAGSLITASGLVIFTGGDNLGTGVNPRSETFAYDVNSNTWKIGPAKPTAVNNLCNMAAFVNNDSLYLVAIGGYTGTTASGANEWLSLGAYQVPSGIIENNSVYSFDAYPNPFTDVTTISLSLKHASSVRAVITDVLGNELAVICDKHLSQGKHKLNWDAVAFAKGVYLCNLIVDGKTFTQKIVKL